MGELRACVPALEEPGQGPAPESESHDHGWGCTMVLLDTRVCSQSWVWCGVPHYQYRAAGSALAGRGDNCPDSVELHGGNVPSQESRSLWWQAGTGFSKTSNFD